MRFLLHPGIVFVLVFSFLGFGYILQPAFADNLVYNGGTIRFDAGDSATLTMKIVSNTAKSEAGDPQAGCNATDGTPAEVNLISDPAGLTFSPSPLVFEQCGVEEFVTISSTIPGSYTVTAVVNDSGSGVYHTQPFGTVRVTVTEGCTSASIITIDSLSPNPTVWGATVLASGSTAIAAECESVTVNWGDGQTTTDIPISGSQWSASHIYEAPGTYNVVAYLIEDGVVESESAPAQIIVNKHSTQLDFSVPSDVVGDTGFTASGNLVDASNGFVGLGITGREITFSGTGATGSLLPVLTNGVTFTGGIEIVSCAVSDTGPCSVDNVGTDPDPLDNKVLHLQVGSKVAFPVGTSEVKLFLQDMGNTPFKYKVVEYTGAVVPCADPNDTPNCPSAGEEFPIVPYIHAVSGFQTINGLTVFNGIKEIVITEVDGSTTNGSIGISAVLTMNTNGFPTEQHMINFETEIGGVKSSPLTLDGGRYFSIGIAPFYEPEALTVQGHFAGDALYEASSSSIESYHVQPNIQNQSGIGGEGAQGDGVSITKYDCSNFGQTDFDKDGICSTWELQNKVSIPGGSYIFFEASDNFLPDVYLEIDAMSGYAPTATEISTIKTIFSAKGIKLHVLLDETNLPVKDTFHVWTDGASPDADADNDFVSVKNNHYGTVAERAAGTLGSGNKNLEAKMHVVRYMLFVKNINTGSDTSCGSSGIAELMGNDAVVAVGCGFGLNPSEERMGTMLHELGHLVGLKHGGNDDANCKPNLKSVMSYSGQVPWSLMPIPAPGQTTDVAWYLGYNSQVLQSLNENSLNDGVYPIPAIDPTKWKASDGVTSITSFRLVWGTPQLVTKVQTGVTGSTINWDKDANANEVGQSIDLNYMSITLGTTQIPACTPAIPTFDTLTSYDEWVTVKNSLNFRSMGTLDGLGYSTHTDADAPSEADGEFFSKLNALGHGLLFDGVNEPLNNNDLGESGIAVFQKGNTIPITFELYDADGIEITDSNLQDYPIQKFTLKVAPVINGQPPADSAYFMPLTSTQKDFRDFFVFDGTKWSLQLGTKNLSPNTTYAARIYLNLDPSGSIVLDKGTDGISFLFELKR